MSHVANYVLLLDGEVRFYGHHWGAVSLHRDVFLGPDALLDLIGDTTPFVGLGNEAGVEAAALVDLDRWRLLFFTGVDARGAFPRRGVFLDLLRRRWSGWDVQWADRGLVDIAEAAGVAVDDVIYRRGFPEPWVGHPETYCGPPYASTSGAEWDPRASDRRRSIQTIVELDGTVHDHVMVLHPDQALSLGPALLGTLAERPPFDWRRCLHPGDVDMVMGGILFDKRSRDMSAWSNGLRPRVREVAAGLWPGWSLEIHQEGLAGQWRASGRDPAPVTPPLADELQAILASLIDIPDVVAQVREVVDGLRARGRRVSVAAGALDPIPVQATAEEAARILDALLADAPGTTT